MMRALPSRFLRLRFLPKDKLWRRPALPALIFPVAVMRKRFAALRLVFNFGIFRSWKKESCAFYTAFASKSSLGRLRLNRGGERRRSRSHRRVRRALRRGGGPPGRLAGAGGRAPPS